MVCKICGAKEEKFFSYNKNKLYCRRCIKFKNKSEIDEISNNSDVELSLDYELTPKQKEISKNLLEGFINHQNSVVNAVCGSGKTEIVFDLIKYCLNNHLKVGFTVPRKDVVIDLYPRFKKAFPKQKIISIYGGHTSLLTGDIIILTTHQLYRYEKYFDLLIIDEIDAFPFYNNEILNNLFYRSIKGNYVMLTATLIDELKSKAIKDKCNIYYLNRRYHNHPLPVPKIYTFLFCKYLFLLYQVYKFKKQNKPLMIFAPTIKKAKVIYNILSFFISEGEIVYSSKENRDQIIENFKASKYSYIVTTSILERGVTIKNVQVIVFDSHHSLYDSKALIQISGRVGRKVDAYEGEVIFIGSYKSHEMVKAQQNIITSNS